MPARSDANVTAHKPGVLIDVARVISVGRDRTTGQAVLRFRDEQDRIVALRLKPQQLRNLALGVLGLAEAMEEEAER